MSSTNERETAHMDLADEEPPAEAAGTAGGTGRGGRSTGGPRRGGRGQGRGGVNTPESRLIKELPAALRACCEDGGWTMVQKPNISPFEILTESEYADKYASKRFRETYTTMADNVSNYCLRHGIANKDAVIFTTLLSNTLLSRK